MKHLARSSIFVAVFFGLSKIFALLRTTIIARQFGLSDDMDAFMVANNIPDLLSALIAGGALSVALIPVLSEYLEKNGRSSAWDLFTRVIKLAFYTTAGIALLLIIFAEQFADIIAPGFHEEKMALTVELMRLDLFAIVIFSISGMIMAGLQANQHFILPALAPILYDIGQIFGALILSPAKGDSFGPVQLPAFDMGIHGLVYGVIIGALLHLLIQVPGLIKYEYKWKSKIGNAPVLYILSIIFIFPCLLLIFFILIWLKASKSDTTILFWLAGILLIIGLFIFWLIRYLKMGKDRPVSKWLNNEFEKIVSQLDPGVWKVLHLLGPRVITMLFIQMFFLVRDNLASSLGEGAVSALNYAWFIMQVPETMLGTAIAITLLPTISEIFTQGDRELFKTTVNSALRAMLALTIPSAALLAVGVAPVAELVFNFGEEGTLLVVWATRAYLLGLIGHSLLEIASRTYYAQQIATIPLYAAALNAIAYIVISSLLSKIWGITGIALANTIVFTTEALILLWLLTRKFPGLFNVSSTFFRVVTATVCSAALLYLLLEFAPFPKVYLSLAGMIGGFVVVIPFIFPEIKLLLNLGTRK